MENAYVEGREAANREFKTDSRLARGYLEECERTGFAEGRDEFDRGFMDAVRVLASKGGAR